MVHGNGRRNGSTSNVGKGSSTGARHRDDGRRTSVLHWSGVRGGPVKVFADPVAPAGLRCRMCRIGTGRLTGVPDVADLAAALRQAVLA
ncbi:hypothetical protein GCM10017581_054990 [Dactylosporangium matsuzakiense]|uniref:Uncharacterized protein n=1 Tax=Dactylosporangium matsuzakiense TaxID=53360 RepID=A0A9W6KM68_9ACTN|nr:hypothetical protein GCM10017581_054990 [Dactylosporangium matsuzakiense]